MNDHSSQLTRAFMLNAVALLLIAAILVALRLYLTRYSLEIVRGLLPMAASAYVIALVLVVVSLVLGKGVGRETNWPAPVKIAVVWAAADGLLALYGLFVALRGMVII